MHMMLISVVLTLQEKIIPPKITQNTIDYNNTASLLSFHKMQPDYIYVNILYISLPAGFLLCVCVDVLCICLIVRSVVFLLYILA